MAGNTAVSKGRSPPSLLPHHQWRPLTGCPACGLEASYVESLFLTPCWERSSASFSISFLIDCGSPNLDWLHTAGNGGAYMVESSPVVISTV